MKQLIAVNRVSTIKQWAKGNSVADQLRDVTAYAKSIGAEIVEEVSVQVSGKKMRINEGVLFKVLKRAEEIGADIAVSKIDRVSRDALTLHQLRKGALDSGVGIHVASMGKTLNEMTSMEFSIWAGLAQMEREQISQRVRNASKKRKAPFPDASANGKASAIKRRALALEWARQVELVPEIKNGIETLRKPTLARLATWLTGVGLVTSTGKAWTPSNLSEQLKRLGYRKWQELAA